MEKQHNYFYRIENTLNGKFYYGVHGTNNLEDGYLGSGKRIKYAIKKYGKENFVKENLLFFETYKQAMDYEVEVVNEELLLDPSCYNLKVGGKGGLGFISAEQQLRRAKAASAASIANRRNNPMVAEKFSEHASKTLKNTHKRGLIRYDTFKNKHHTKEAKESMGLKNSINQTGSGNSQYGKCWVYNNIESKSIKKEDLEAYLINGWQRGRKIIF